MKPACVRRRAVVRVGEGSAGRRSRAGRASFAGREAVADCEDVTGCEDVAGRDDVAGRRVRVGRWVLIGLLTVAVVGCGESVELPDLFVVQRTGAGPKLTVVVNEGGAVRCNGGPTRQLSDAQIVQARGLQEELQSPSAKHLALPPRPGSVFSYYVRDAEGTVRFSDNSAGQTSVLRHLAYFVLEAEQQVCHLPG